MCDIMARLCAFNFGFNGDYEMRRAGIGAILR